MIDKGFHPGRAAEHRLQIRQFGKDVEIGADEGEIFDIRHSSRVRPNAKFQIGKLCRKVVAPGLRVADLLVESDDEQGRIPSLVSIACCRAASATRSSASHGGLGMTTNCVLKTP